VIVASSIFKNNRAKDDGGAIYIASGCNLTLRNSLVVGNSASSQGGAIYHVGG